MSDLFMPRFFVFTTCDRGGKDKKSRHNKKHIREQVKHMQCHAMYICGELFLILSDGDDILHFSGWKDIFQDVFQVAKRSTSFSLYYMTVQD